MKRPKLEDYIIEINDGQDFADWYESYYKALEKYADFLESKAGHVDTIVMWQSVEDILPKNYEDVLIYDGNEIITGRISKIDSFNGNALNVLSSNGYYHNSGATYWAKLPAPPKDT